MKKIWLIHPVGFYPAVAHQLSDRGIQVAYVLASSQVLGLFSDLTSDSIKHLFLDAASRRLPEGFEGHVGAPDPAIIDALAESEPIVFQMLGRINYPRLAIHDLRRVYFDYVALWCRILERSRPDAVLFHMQPPMGVDYVLYLLCQHMGIRTLIVEITSIPDLMILMERIELMPEPAAENLSVFKSSDGMSGELLSPTYYDANNQAFEDVRKRRLTRLDSVRDIVGCAIRAAHEVIQHPLRALKSSQSSLFALNRRMPTRLEYVMLDIVYAFRMYRLRDFYESRTAEPDLGTNYVYFALHFQPERSTVPMGLTFGDQLLALSVVADCLPPGWLVYVKEHPRQFHQENVRGSMARSRDFYNSLLSIRPDRVRLVSINTPSDSLIRNSRCVGTIAGTTGWEAIRSGVPVMAFGAPWYMNCPGVLQVGTMEQCRQAMAHIQAGAKVDPNTVDAFIEWLRSAAGFPGYMAERFERVSSLSADENVRSYATAIADRINEGPENTPSSRAAGEVATA